MKGDVDEGKKTNKQRVGRKGQMNKEKNNNKRR